MPQKANLGDGLRPTGRTSQQQATTNKIKLLILLVISNNPGQIGAYSTIAPQKTPQKYS